MWPRSVHTFRGATYIIAADRGAGGFTMAPAGCRRTPLPLKNREFVLGYRELLAGNSIAKAANVPCASARPIDCLSRWSSAGLSAGRKRPSSRERTEDVHALRRFRRGIEERAFIPLMQERRPLGPLIGCSEHANAEHHWEPAPELPSSHSSALTFVRNRPRWLGEAEKK